jgi:hypothetical protein
MEPDHPSYINMRLAMEALCTGSEPIRPRLLAADRHLSKVNPADLRSKAEWVFYHRIVSGLVEGGDEADEDADEDVIAQSLAELDDIRVVAIACDILHLYELVADVSPTDALSLWLGG